MILEYNIGSLVEPMVWHYNSFEMFSLGSTLWDKYSNIFPNIWIATAYKGATGCSQVFLSLNQTFTYQSFSSNILDLKIKFESKILQIYHAD